MTTNNAASSLNLAIPLPVRAFQEPTQAEVKSCTAALSLAGTVAEKKAALKKLFSGFTDDVKRKVRSLFSSSFRSVTQREAGGAGTTRARRKRENFLRTREDARRSPSGYRVTDTDALRVSGEDLLCLRSSDHDLRQVFHDGRGRYVHTCLTSREVTQRAQGLLWRHRFS